MYTRNISFLCQYLHTPETNTTTPHKLLALDTLEIKVNTIFQCANKKCIFVNESILKIVVSFLN